MSSYDIGDRRKLTCEVRDEDGDLADPTALTFTMREPDATLTVYVWQTDAELVRTAVGTFHTYWDCSQAGAHRWRFAATGTVAAAEESAFAVRTSQVI
jgi:hypothetical protein